MPVMNTLRSPRTIAGALGAGLALTGATWLAAQILGVEAAFQTMADQITLWLPPRVFSYLIFHLQHWGKPLFLLGLAAAWTVLGVVLALLVWSRKPASVRF